MMSAYKMFFIYATGRIYKNSKQKILLRRCDIS